MPQRPGAGGQKTDTRNLLALQRGLTGNRSLAGAGYMDDPSLLAAYDDYYRHVSRAQMLRICDLTGLRPRSVLDMGAGPGSMSLALAERGARSFALVDASAKALELARASLTALTNGTGTKGTVDASGIPCPVSVKVADLESPDAVPEGRFNLVVFGHCLNEIGTGDDRIERRLAVVQRTATVLAPGGAVLVIDPATLAASRDALALRDMLVTAGWRVRAPCTWGGACPALATGPNHTCHDESAWDVPPGVRRLAESAGLDRDLIKMSWYLVEPPVASSGAGPRPEMVAASFQADGPQADLPEPALVPEAAYRVVSVPMLNKGGRVRFLLCGAGGRFPFSAKKDDDAARRAGFFDLRRYDLVKIAEPEIREGGWGFGLMTRMVKIDLPLSTRLD